MLVCNGRVEANGSDALHEIWKPRHLRDGECLYDRLLDDPELAPFFKSVDIDRLREHVADFLSVLTGGPDMYRGRDLREAHSDYRITAAHFEMVMAHIAAAATELEIEPDDIAAIATAIRGYEADVVSG